MRVLGESRDIVTRCATVHSATGNNLVIVGDMTRRSLKGKLDPKVERPELQQFDYDPIADASANRGELVAAALTILRATISPVDRVACRNCKALPNGQTRCAAR